MKKRFASVQLELKGITAILEIAEQIGQVGMPHRFPGFVRQKVLLRHIGHIVGLVIFGQQVIERLVLCGAAVFGTGVIPFFGVGKPRVDIKDHTAEGVLPVADNLPDVKFGLRGKHDIASLEFFY